MWEYEFPYQLGVNSWRKAMKDDTFNECGGSVYRLSNGHYLAAFTAGSAAAAETFDERVRTAFAWELDVDSASASADGEGANSPNVVAQLAIPIPHSDAGKQNAYRFTPWSSVYGGAVRTRSLGRTSS